jgi:hypothetical protein
LDVLVLAQGAIEKILELTCGGIQLLLKQPEQSSAPINFFPTVAYLCSVVRRLASEAKAVIVMIRASIELEALTDVGMSGLSCVKLERCRGHQPA